MVVTGRGFTYVRVCLEGRLPTLFIQTSLELQTPMHIMWYDTPQLQAGPILPFPIPSPPPRNITM